MSSPSQVAAGFTITGLLDGASRTRGRYPVSEIAVADIADHPANAAYSMDPAGIAELAGHEAVQEVEKEAACDNSFTHRSRVSHLTCGKARR